MSLSASVSYTHTPHHPLIHPTNNNTHPNTPHLPSPLLPPHTTDTPPPPPPPQHNTTQHNTTQHNTTQHNTTDTHQTQTDTIVFAVKVRINHTELIVGHMHYHLTHIPHLIVLSCTNLSSMGTNNKLKAEQMCCDAGFSVRCVQVVVLQMGIKHAFLFWSRENSCCSRTKIDACTFKFTLESCLNLITWREANFKRVVVAHCRFCAFVFCNQGTLNDNQVSFPIRDFSSSCATLTIGQCLFSCAYRRRRRCSISKRNIT